MASDVKKKNPFCSGFPNGSPETSHTSSNPPLNTPLNHNPNTQFLPPEIKLPPRRDPQKSLPTGFNTQSSPTSRKQNWSSVARGFPPGGRNGRRVTSDELERLQQVFSDSVIIPSEKLRAARQKWSSALIGKFLGRRMDSDFIARALSHKWKVVGDLEIIPILEGFLIFRFTNEEDRMRIQTSGPWVVGGSVLALEEWRPNFKPQRETVTKAMVWVRMPGLPLEYWEREIVLAIASKAGRPVEVDICTTNLARGAFARVCIEVDLTKPLVAGCPVSSSEEVIDFFQEFVYEGIGIYCYRCGMVGHRLVDCACPEALGACRNVAKLAGEKEVERKDKEGGAWVDQHDGQKGEMGELYGPWLSVSTSRHRRRPPPEMPPEPAQKDKSQKESKAALPAGKRTAVRSVSAARQGTGTKAINVAAGNNCNEVGIGPNKVSGPKTFSSEAQRLEPISFGTRFLPLDDADNEQEAPLDRAQVTKHYMQTFPQYTSPVKLRKFFFGKAFVLGSANIMEVEAGSEHEREVSANSNSALVPFVQPEETKQESVSMSGGRGELGLTSFTAKRVVTHSELESQKTGRKTALAKVRQAVDDSTKLLRDRTCDQHGVGHHNTEKAKRRRSVEVDATMTIDQDMDSRAEHISIQPDSVSEEGIM